LTWGGAALLVACTDVDRPATGNISPSVSTAADECASPQPGWIWCDDFEQDRLGQYFEYDNAGGRFVRAAGVGVDGSQGMRVHFDAGSVGAGYLHLAMGKVPSTYFRTVDAGTAVYRDVYWRLYLRNQPGWTGGAGYKLDRAISFVTSNWAEAMAAHLWGGEPTDPNYLALDPASGTDAAGNLQVTGYNQFARWLGWRRGVTPLFDASHVGQRTRTTKRSSTTQSTGWEALT
jgi:hypothetical protein